MMTIFTSIKKWIPFGRVNEISAQKLEEAINSNTDLQLVDVRTESEWKLSAIEGSVNLPITHFKKSEIEKLDLDPKKLTVAICLSAHRSIPAVRVLDELGFSDVVQLKGGMKAWWSLKLPTIKNV